MNSSFPKKIGILGGGQLARMLALSCYELGLTPFVYCKSKTDSAAQVVSELFHDNGRVDSLMDFASRVDLIILENEFINLENLKQVEAKTLVLPSVKVLEKIQNKLHQKISLGEAGLPTADFFEIKNASDLEKAVKKLGSKLVLKSAHMGYDGKGVVFFDSQKTTPSTFFNQNPLFNGYAEKRINFKKEIAVVVVQNIEGKALCFPPVETHQSDGICHWVVKPTLSSTILKKAAELAVKTIQEFDGVGAFGIEMFLDSKNRLLINEIAPRVHNSGHITMDACNISQFEQHLRAVTGMQMVKPVWNCKGAAMVNIITREENVNKALEFNSQKLTSNMHIHWYGKKTNIAKRKVGHINITGVKSVDCLKLGMKTRDALTV